MFVVFDIETTGFSTTKADIIQFAYCLFDGNNNFVRAENLYFYYEGMSWSQEAADASHHLSLEFLKQYEDAFETNVLKMYSVLNHANVCGHNSNHFDCPFVKNWLSRMGLSSFDFGICQDTMLAYRPLTKKSKIKLTVLSEMMNYTPQLIQQMAETWFKDNIRGPHDAAYDVAATSLLTLRGIAKNLIRFEAVPVTQDVLDMSLFESEDVLEDKRTLDPYRYLVRLITSQGAPQYRWVNHNRKLFKDVDDPLELSAEDEKKLLAADLIQQDINTYMGERNGTVYTLILGEQDRMKIHTEFLDTEDTQVPMLLMISKMHGGA